MHAPRFRGIRRLRTLQTNIDQIAQMAGSLKKEKDTVLKSAASLSAKVRLLSHEQLFLPSPVTTPHQSMEARPIAFLAERDQSFTK